MLVHDLLPGSRNLGCTAPYDHMRVLEYETFTPGPSSDCEALHNAISNRDSRYRTLPLYWRARGVAMHPGRCMRLVRLARLVTPSLVRGHQCAIHGVFGGDASASANAQHVVLAAVQPSADHDRGASSAFTLCNIHVKLSPPYNTPHGPRHRCSSEDSTHPGGPS
ncbi:hypothetical protein P171DRAFT_196699 [Karstenula rhodostoma CBS 690.94]|uniref:Uncharacterized protein n=1 Tax=Karstenula rhodostoma CBS 690.94 TaxID=1392251 RepID=A0A9P4PUM1_9PLEO|nr:hypothetical protein P171DRAFT_196699 [Karstenula rhodostoma CBS 690.94]